MAGHNTTQNRKVASRAIISALVLWLAFSGMAAAEQLYVSESGWWRDGGAFNASGTPISAAVGAASEGDAIYVEGGNYYENVDVDTPRLTLVGAGADVVTVTAADSGDHVFEVTKDYVNISEFAVRGTTDHFIAGIYLDNVDYCDISSNKVYGNRYGIYLSSSSSNTLTNNTALNNDDGIYLTSSSNNNTLTDNNASNNRYGIVMGHSSNNKLYDNTANSNNGGIHLAESSNNNTLTNNTALNNNDGIYLTSSSNNNTLTDNNASNNNAGICLTSSSSNTFTNNIANSNNGGIYLSSSSNNNITCNWVQNNAGKSFLISGGSTNNNISYNNIVENGNYNAASGGWEWQFYMNQYQPVEARHNYWGARMNNSTIDASIYDDEEGEWGEVEFYPFETEPVPCAPTPVEPPAFTTADAVIALQIAAGSRPPDLCWDASGDGSVTSLDALMILQAAAGGIEIG